MTAKVELAVFKSCCLKQFTSQTKGNYEALAVLSHCDLQKTKDTKTINKDKRAKNLQENEPLTL